MKNWLSGKAMLSSSNGRDQNAFKNSSPISNHTGVSNYYPNVRNPFDPRFYTQGRKAESPFSFLKRKVTRIKFVKPCVTAPPLPPVCSVPPPLGCPQPCASLPYSTCVGPNYPACIPAMCPPCFCTPHMCGECPSWTTFETLNALANSKKAMYESSKNEKRYRYIKYDRRSPTADDNGYRQDYLLTPSKLRKKHPKKNKHTSPRSSMELSKHHYTAYANNENQRHGSTDENESYVPKDIGDRKGSLTRDLYFRKLPLEKFGRHKRPPQIIVSNHVDEPQEHSLKSKRKLDRSRFNGLTSDDQTQFISGTENSSTGSSPTTISHTIKGSRKRSSASKGYFMKNVDSNFYHMMHS